MTIPEAVQLVIQAGDLGAASGEVFVLEMGEPVKIIDLARNMIRLAGYEPDADIAIEFIGVAAGREAPRGALQRRRARRSRRSAERIVRAVRAQPARPRLGRGDGRAGSTTLVASGRRGRPRRARGRADGASGAAADAGRAIAAPRSA